MSAHTKLSRELLQTTKHLDDTYKEYERIQENIKKVETMGYYKNLNRPAEKINDLKHLHILAGSMLTLREELLARLGMQVMSEQARTIELRRLYELGVNEYEIVDPGK